MHFSYDHNFEFLDQPPDRFDFERCEDFDDGWPVLLGEEFAPPDGSPDIPPKPQTIGILGSGGLSPLGLDEIRKILPRELQEGQTWCVWIFEFYEAGGKWKKRPFVPFRGSRVGCYPAGPDKPKNWVSLCDAYRAATRDDENLIEGIGRFFSAGDPYVGIDLDHCLDYFGGLASWAGEVLAMFPGAYVEYSPSGTGLKLWTRGRLSGGKKKAGFGLDGTGAVEVYDQGRFFTVTARPYGEPVQTIADGSAAVLELYEHLGGERKAKPRTTGERAGAAPSAAQDSGSNGISVLSDEEVTARARRAYHEFASLYDSGDRSQYGDDKSRADAAMVKQIAFFAGGDRDQILRIFGRSALGQRAKWMDRPEYRERTITAILSRMTRFYDPSYRSNSHRSAAGGSSQLGGGG